MNYEPDPDEVDVEIDETPTDKQLTHDIDEALGKVRPERYDAGDKEWMDEVVELVQEAAERRDRADVFADWARRRVYRREAEATKRTNRILRDIDATGQLPLGWGEGDSWRELLFDLLHLPLSIARERVRLGVANAQDLEQWELESAREEDKRRAAQISARSGARLLGQWLKDQGASRVEDLRVGDSSGAAS